MKKPSLVWIIVLLSTVAWAQVPQKMSYQAIIRNASNVVVASSTVGIKLSLVQGNPNGSTVFAERHSKTTNANGLLSLEIGGGVALSGNFSTIDWGKGPYFIKTETDPSGGGNYSIVGTTELLSVPYALYAANGTPGPQGERGAIGATGPQGPVGPTGATGATGTPGAAGVDGRTVLNGTSNPTSTTGTNGDFYINTSANTIFGPKANGAWPLGVSMVGPQGSTGATGPAGPTGTAGASGTTGLTGAAGAAGEDGRTVLNGTSNPTSSTGANGDFYINTSTNTLFGPKGSGVWPSGISLVGPQGATGPQGLQGLQGIQGAQGPAGVLSNGSAAGNTPYWNGSSWVTNSSTIFNNGGNIGIGTTSPSSLFHVVGSGSGGDRNNMIRVESNNNASLTLKNTNASAGGGEYQLFSSSSASNPSLGAGSFAIYYDHPSNAAYRFAINTSGNVGIGTGMPTEKLDVSGNLKTSGTIRAGAITYPNTAGTNGQFLTTDGSGTASWATIPSGGASSVGAISGTSTANGASITSGVLNLAPANGSNGGVVTTESQTFAGAKTFSNDIVVNGVKIGRGAGNNDQNVAVGADALASGTGTRNTAVGYGAMRQYSGTSFDNNTSIGYWNMSALTSGNGNTSVGAESMLSITTGTQNTSIGNQSLISTTGNDNVGVGKRSGETNTTGSQNTFIGTNSNAGSNNLSNATALGYGATVATSNTMQLGNSNISNVKTSGTLTAGVVTYPNTDGTAGQVLTANANGIASWSNNAGASSVGAITNTSISNGASITSGILNLAAANESSGGVVTTGDQTFAGNKGIKGNLTLVRFLANELLDQSSTAPYAGSGAYTSAWQSFTVGTTGILSKVSMQFYNSQATGTLYIYQGRGIGGTQLTSQPFSIATSGDLMADFILSNPVSVVSGVEYTMAFITTSGTIWEAMGGPNSYTAGATYIGNNPSSNSNTNWSILFRTYVSQYSGGTLTAGEITYPNTAGTNGYFLKTDGAGTASWAAVPSGGTTMGSISNTSTTNGASITSGVLNLAPADGTNGGIVTNGTQTFAGAKTLANTTVSTSSSTGALVVSGGVGIGGNTNIAGALAGANTATSTISGFAANINNQTGTTYQLVASDNGKIITFNNSGSITVTAPAGLLVGFNCMIVQLGTGQVTIAAGAGATITNRSGYNKTGGQNALMTVLSVTSNSFISSGDMSN